MFNDIGEDEVTSNSPHKYLMPSLLLSHNYNEAPRSIQSKFLYIYCYVGGSVTTEVSNLSQVVENRGFLPPGLFQRYVARILNEVDAASGDHRYKFLNKDQVWLYIGRTKITLSALSDKGSIRIDYEGEAENQAVYGPLKLMEEIVAEVKTECFHKLEAVNVAPYPIAEDQPTGFIRLDVLSLEENNFEVDHLKFDIAELKSDYATFLQPNAMNIPFDVFISYKWGEARQKVARTLLNKLGRTLIPSEKNRPLRVQYISTRRKIRWEITSLKNAQHSIILTYSFL